MVFLFNFNCHYHVGTRKNRKQIWKRKNSNLWIFMYSIGAFAFLLVNSIVPLMLVLAFNALLSGITIPAYKTLFTHLQDKGRESEEWSWLEASSMVAISVGSAIGGIVLAVFGFDGLFIIMGTIQFIAGIIMYKSLNHKISIEGDLLKATSVAKNILQK